MKPGKHILIITFSFFIQSALLSMPADTTSIIDNIYNYDFNKAAERLSRLNGKDPFVCEALSLEIKWWMSVERSDPDKFLDFLATLEKLENSDKNDLSEIVFLTYRMRYYASAGKNLTIPFLFLKVRRKVSKIDSEILLQSGRDGYELFVLYKSFLTLIQNNLLTDKFQSGANKNTALINDIETIVKYGCPSNRAIGSYFLMKYYLDVEKDKPMALGYLTALHKQYPNNLIFTQLLTN